MKIRQGFVSNSSSSSFCVWGARIDFDAIKGILESKGFIDEDDKDFNADPSTIVSDFLCSEKINETTLDFVASWDSECLYIGRPYDSLKDNETGKQFKEQAEKDMAQILGKEVKCKFINEEVST